MYNKLKYIGAYVVPAALFISLYFAAWWSYGGLILAFVIIPFLELFLPKDIENFDDTTEQNTTQEPIYSWYLYFNVPLLYGGLAWYVYKIAYTELATYETVGLTLTMGIALGVMGINVAHELGHKSTWYEQLMAKMLLLPNFYMHFFIEHNRGHHVNIATDEDPASSRLNEWVYAFWLRSVLGGYLSAWHLEINRLKYINKSFFSVENEMLWYHFWQSLYFGLVLYFLGLQIALLILAAGLVGILLLETVNYIEHYGLRRQKLASGRYERVQPYHSWNADYVLGRIVLYELTRHSDHHYKAARKYQILRHLESPQLPMGYPAAMLLSLFPPLWFWAMNPKVEYYRQQLPLAG